MRGSPYEHLPEMVLPNSDAGYNNPNGGAAMMAIFALPDGLEWICILSSCLLLIVGVAVLLVLLLWRQKKRDNATRCRKCGYILRGITEPRCPECGERI